MQLDLHQAAKQGDLETVLRLLEAKDVDVNALDAFDSTPLFYAALCGSLEVAELLLANGARCDAGTFVGERCYYAALNDDIRRALKAYGDVDFSKQQRHAYGKFLLRLRQERRFHDVAFHDGDERICSAPRVVLGARSPALRKRFLAKWRGAATVPAPASRHPAPLRAVVDYACCGRFVADDALVGDALAVARALGFGDLARFLAGTRAAAPGKAVVYEDELPSLRASFAPLAEAAARPGAGDPEVEAFARDHGDVPLRSNDGAVFRVPGAFLRLHSSALDAACSDRWRSGGAAIALDASARAVGALVRWCVSGACADASWTRRSPRRRFALAHELMMPAELSRAAAGALAGCLEAVEDDRVAAALAALPYAALAGERGRLYDAVVDVLSKHVAEAVASPGFRDAVLESARSIQARQATDSIPLVDDIRVALHDRVNPFDEYRDEPAGTAEAAELAKLDGLLEELGLSG
ncbi:hypothetical protein JL722_12134 [Aureococcus anophagefferens]|nr:hypothetical protein JL722_12134 [Aureococcus anophagefferens]